MKLVIPIAACILFGVFLVMISKRAHSDFLAPEKLRELANEGAVIFDVRTVEEFNAGHIEGARHIPFDEIEGRLAEINLAKDAPILLYCARGGRAETAKETLDKFGFTRVYNGGGFMDLKRAGL